MMSMVVRIFLFFFLTLGFAQAQQAIKVPVAYEFFFPNGYVLEKLIDNTSEGKKSTLLLARHFEDTEVCDTLRAFMVEQVGLETDVKSIYDFTSKEKQETNIQFVYNACLILNDSSFLVGYQTIGPNGLDDGRLKLILYFGNKKIGIRHQNGVLDFQRYTQIDPSFYLLPVHFQTRIRSILLALEKEGSIVLPANWSTAMDAKQTMIKED